MIGVLLYLVSVVCLAIGLLAATGHGPSNALAWFIGGMLVWVVSQLVASWETIKRVPRP